MRDNGSFGFIILWWYPVIGKNFLQNFDYSNCLLGQTPDSKDWWASRDWKDWRWVEKHHRSKKFQPYTQTNYSNLVITLQHVFSQSSRHFNMSWKISRTFVRIKLTLWAIFKSKWKSHSTLFSGSFKTRNDRCFDEKFLINWA